MKLIAFSGPMGSGKSTAIKHLETQTRVRVFLVKFAQPLYDMQDAIYDSITPVFTRRDGFTKDRKLLQWLGTDWGRDTISPTLWVDLWKREVTNIQENFPDSIIVCDDVRFDNEAKAVRERGGVVVKLVSPAARERAEGGTGIVAHKSEIGIDPKLVDYEVNNTGSMAQFQSALSSLYKGFLHI